MADPTLDLPASLVSIDTTNDPAGGIKPGKAMVDLVKDVLTEWGIEANIIESDGYYPVCGEIGI